MRAVEENDIGKLLHKMRERQSNIRNALDYDMAKYSRKSASVPVITPTLRTQVPSLSASCSTASFETRLQRIRQIRKKFEDKYSILRTSNTQNVESMANPPLSGRSKRPHSAQLSARQTADSVSPTIDIPLTARDDLDIHNNTDTLTEIPKFPNGTNQEPQTTVQTTKQHIVSESSSNIIPKESHPADSSPDLSQDLDTESLTAPKPPKSSKSSMNKQFQSTSRSNLNTKATRKRSGDRLHSRWLGDLPENIYFEIYQNLDAISLAKQCRVCSSWHSTIIQSIRFMFSIPFQSYPTRLPPKTIFFTLKKLHFLDQKSCGELLFWSCARGYDAFVRHFMANIDKSHSSSLRLPFIKRHLNAISKVDDMTSLHIAAKHNQLHIVQLLVSHPTVDVNRLTKSGKHAVIIAAQRSNYEIVDKLLSHSQINVDQMDAEQRSLLHILCAKGDLYAVNAVLDKGADPNVVDKENRSPLYIAAENGYTDLCRCLLRRNHEIRAQWKLDQLDRVNHSQSRESRSDQKEPDYPVDIHLCSKSGKSPLYVASENGHVEVVAFLLKNGANVRQETCRGKIPLYAAAEKQYVDIVREILPFTMEKDLFKLTHYGTTVMFIASKQSNKTVKKMLIAFCSAQKKKLKAPKTNNAVIVDHQGNHHETTTNSASAAAAESEEESKEESQAKEWMNATVDLEAQRLGTPKFKEQFESFQEMKQKRKRNKTFTKTTAFLERMNNLIKVADAAEEEKDPSVPRIVEKENAPKMPVKRRRRRIRRRISVESAVEAKEEDPEMDDMDLSASEVTEAAETRSEPVRPKKCAFDFNRLYRGKLRNKSGDDIKDKSVSVSEKEEKVDGASEPKKQWKGFSDRFMMRNLIGTNGAKNGSKMGTNQSDVDSHDDDVDEMLAIDEEEELKRQKERDRISKEAASRFLERQKERNLEAQKRAKERINEYRDRDQMERKRLMKKREAARVLAMKVAAKIQQKERYDENLKVFSQDIASTAPSQVETEEEDAVSDPRLNLFDKMRRRGISNDNFQNGYGCTQRDDHQLHSHRSLSTLDDIKREKRRSLEVTGRILNVLSDGATKSSGGDMESDREIDSNGIGMDSDLEAEEDGYLFLHPLSKRKRKKMRRNKLEAAYGIAMKPKRKRKTGVGGAYDGPRNKDRAALGGLLQINSMNPQFR